MAVVVVGMVTMPGPVGKKGLPGYGIPKLCP